MINRVWNVILLRKSVPCLPREHTLNLIYLDQISEKNKLTNELGLICVKYLKQYTWYTLAYIGLA